MRRLYKYLIFIATIAVICVLCSFEFVQMWEDPQLYPGTGLTDQLMLSNWFDGIENTAFDTPVYHFKGDTEGAKILILGGTHANEPAAALTAITLLENISSVEFGELYVIPWANHSGATHTDPMEGNPEFFTINTGDDQGRTFRFGSRKTNSIHQWPDPTIYNHQMGTTLGGQETLNLNRCYPGKKDGYGTEQVAYAIVELIKNEGIDLAIDLHESSPEYPVNNAIVFHQDAAELAVTTQMMMEMSDVTIGLEESPVTLRGLSHREWGDATDAMAVLFEVANPSQGRMRGKSSEELILTGKDKFYVNAAKRGQLFVSYDESGYSLDLRVARHLATITGFFDSWNMLYPEKMILADGVPTYEEILSEGLGTFLKVKK
ncbi:MAG TPA: succinylglutamate desuccinylase [Thermotogota bacterium]|mgnify:CR=1 FL=1|nr:succinylglutamate desuccinylase [Thermotogota bacterium]HPJ88469.1 succinylglutamate desuccinylase [Thermotogota bacterium]HPR96492.1 succinylglutamate desuccinylase [Thermotogota bacterium]